MHCCGRGDHGVEESLGNRFVVTGGDRIGVHMDADVADQQHASSGESYRVARRCEIRSVRLERTGDVLSTLGECRFQGSFHDPEPVAVNLNFVGRIDCGDGILAVLNGCDRGFQQNVLDTGRVFLADWVLAIDLNFHMQLVMNQQHYRK